MTYLLSITPRNVPASRLLIFIEVLAGLPVRVVLNWCLSGPPPLLTGKNPYPTCPNYRSDNSFRQITSAEHGVRNNLKLRIKTEPVTAGSELRSNVQYEHMWPRNQTYSVASVPTVNYSVFMRRFKLVLGQCSGEQWQEHGHFNMNENMSTE